MLLRLLDYYCRYTDVEVVRVLAAALRVMVVVVVPMALEMNLVAAALAAGAPILLLCFAAQAINNRNVSDASGKALGKISCN